MLVALMNLASSTAIARPLRQATLPTSGSFLYLNSQPGDYIGEGVERILTSSDSTVWASLPRSATYFTARFLQGVGHSWFVAMDAPRGQPLAVGSYAGAIRAGFEPAGTPGLSIDGEGRGCNAINGRFDVSEIRYSPEGVLLAFDATFEQHCDGVTAPLLGRIRYVDETTPGVHLPPGNIAIPAGGTYLYLNNTNGSERLFTTADSRFEPWVMLAPGGDAFHAVLIQGDGTGAAPNVDLAAPVGQTLAVGSYVRAVRAMLRTPTAPGLDVGASCEVSGKFDIDALSFAPSGELLLFQATFEQRCVNTTEILYGRIRVENRPPTARVVLPAGSIAVPSSGTFLYLNSQVNDYVGIGTEALYTSGNSSFSGSLNEAGDYFSAFLSQNSFAHFWFADIAAAPGVPLAAGSYRHVERAVYRTEGVPGLDVAGDGRGCNTVMGRFDVDQFALWPDGELKVIDVTFEQHCEGLASALYGRLRYEAPPLDLSLSVREDVVVVSKGAGAVVSGTIACGQAATVEVSGTLRETTKAGTVTGSFYTVIACTAPATRWSFVTSPDAGAFATGVGSVSANATTCLRLCHVAPAARSVKLNPGRS